VTLSARPPLTGADLLTSEEIDAVGLAGLYAGGGAPRDIGPGEFGVGGSYTRVSRGVSVADASQKNWRYATITVERRSSANSAALRCKEYATATEVAVGSHACYSVYVQNDRWRIVTYKIRPATNIDITARVHVQDLAASGAWPIPGLDVQTARAQDLANSQYYLLAKRGFYPAQ
jgi:hypothetical protein